MEKLISMNFSVRYEDAIILKSRFLSTARTGKFSVDWIRCGTEPEIQLVVCKKVLKHMLFKEID
jgi:hypothetical protein